MCIRDRAQVLGAGQYGQAQRRPFARKNLDQLQEQRRVEDAEREAVEDRADDEAGNLSLIHI